MTQSRYEIGRQLMRVALLMPLIFLISRHRLVTTVASLTSTSMSQVNTPSSAVTFIRFMLMDMLVEMMFTMDWSMPFWSMPMMWIVAWKRSLKSSHWVCNRREP